jgi:hypothetical protein
MRFRRRVIRFTATISLLLFAVACETRAQVLPAAVDPVFRLKFDSRVVRFDPVPPALKSLCPGLANARWDRQSYIFAETKSAATRYLLIGGFFANRPQANRKSVVTTDDFGVALRIDGDKCQTLDPVRDFLEYPPAGTPATILDELAHDAACRYTRAFGSFEKLSMALKRARGPLNSLANAAFQQAFAKPPANCK